MIHVSTSAMDNNTDNKVPSSHSHLGEALKSMAMLAFRLSSYDRGENGRPVPAPRPSRNGTDKISSYQARSCSVPPNTRHMWLHVGRELNVDDGLSIRSESTQSLVSLKLLYLYIFYINYYIL